MLIQIQILYIYIYNPFFSEKLYRRVIKHFVILCNLRYSAYKHMHGNSCKIKEAFFGYLAPL